MEKTPIHSDDGASSYRDHTMLPQQRQWGATLLDCLNFPALAFCSLFFPVVPLARQVARARMAPYVMVFVVLLTVTFITSTCGAMQSSWNAEHTTVVSDEDGFHVEADEPYPAWYFVVVGIGAILGMGFCIFRLALRRTLISRYDLEEPFWKTLVVTSFCGPCAIGQQAIHVDVSEFGEVDQDCTLIGEHKHERPVTEVTPVHQLL